MNTEPKFKIGQEVKFIGDTDAEVGQVVSYSFEPDRGFVYRISSREVDLTAKKVIEGFKICLETELVEVKKAEEENE